MYGIGYMISNQPSGSLYIVATPIGNLEDITIRAIRILNKVDFILCEDKRVTIKLLNKHKIVTKLISFHKFNENKLLDEIILKLKSGKNIALVSDAGTPVISDPGVFLVRSATENNIKVISVPGPSSLTAALSICPYMTDEFLYLGFLPDEKGERAKIISKLRERSKTVLLFIAPHDLSKYLNEIYNFYPDVDVFYTREITKMFEDSWCGKIKDLLSIEKKIKGEIVLILNFDVEVRKDDSLNEENVLKEMKNFIQAGRSLKDASKELSKEYNVSSKHLYNLYIKNKKGS